MLPLFDLGSRSLKAIERGATAAPRSARRPQPGSSRRSSSVGA